MLTAEQIRDKIYALADAFEEHYAAKQYALAKADYDKASTMAVFMELPREDIYELFMNHNPRESKDAEQERMEPVPVSPFLNFYEFA